MDEKVAAEVLETLLSAPGMNDNVKLDMKISRKNVLLLTQVINRGLGTGVNEKETGVLGKLQPHSVEELTVIAKDLLEKAGLQDMSERIERLLKTK